MLIYFSIGVQAVFVSFIAFSFNQLELFIQENHSHQERQHHSGVSLGKASNRKSPEFSGIFPTLVKPPPPGIRENQIK